MTGSLGLHWVFDGFGAPPERLRDRALLTRVLQELPRQLGLTAVSQPQCFEHADVDQASLAGIILLSESHFSLHLLPDHGLLHGDLFSCKSFDIPAARGYLQGVFGLSSLKEQTLTRGAHLAIRAAAG